MTKDMEKQAWSLHCTGMTVSEIADRLTIGEEDARAAIVGKWYEDKLENKQLRASGRRGWR